jgi:MarR family 2-MHQ and catechol resistance regulon transcriptional repressor
MRVWLLMNEAIQAVEGRVHTGIQNSGLGDSDFRVLEVLLHKGSLPVNIIGIKVNLRPGSISAAVDRLLARDLVSRVESIHDRRVRNVSLTTKGKDLILPVFHEHVINIAAIFAELSRDELHQLAKSLKKIGKRAQLLSAYDG